MEKKKFCLKWQKTLNSVTVLRKNKASDITLPDSKPYYNAIAIKTVWYWHKNRYITSYTIESQEITLTCLVYQYSTKEPRILMGKGLSLQQLVLWKLDYCRKLKLDPYIIPLIKINLQWIKDLNIRPKTIKFLGENIGTILDITPGNDFLELTVQSTSSKSIK